jgi:hypothetical protein
MRFMTRAVCLLSFSLLANMMVVIGFEGPAFAAMQVKESQIYIGTAYRTIPMKGKNASACQRACGKDKRCLSWTFVRIAPMGMVQCRLYNEVGRSVKNGCCVSGFKQAKNFEQAKGKRGQQVKRCRAWADDAIKLNEQNISNDCGYRGRAWHSNEQRHFRRCMQLGPKSLRAERRGQRQAIKSCVAELGYTKRAYCDHYAKIAVVQNQSRRQASCDAGKNGLWSNNQKAVYKWCLGAERAEAQNRQEVRRKALNRCFRQGREKAERSGPCHDYAQSAIADFRENVRKGCDLHGLTWHNNYERHLNWCRMNSAKARRSEAKKRNLVLKTCKLFGKFKIEWR